MPAPPSRRLSPLIPPAANGAASNASYSASPSPSPSIPSAPSPLSRSHTPSEPIQALADELQPSTEKGDDATGVEEALEPASLALGRLGDDEYSKLLPGWRDTVRKALVRSLRREMDALVWIQSWRTPALDEYFVKTSLLGTHSFFMICVPMPFWFGHGDLGRGLLYVLAAGGYLTSVLKDLFCVPRPFSPPLVRLSVGNHALEYGFPSTHSTTTVSMALYFGELLYRHGTDHTLLNATIYAALALTATSVVFGRLYTGMHSILDVVVGSFFGVVVWLAYYLLENVIESYTVSSGLLVTLTMIPSTLFLVFVHPAPAEDCPCFEDAVAFLSVVLGILVGRNWYPIDFLETTVGATINSPLSKSAWAAAVLAKLLIGVLSIFTWRLVAKEVCHAVLPPIFRAFSSFLLPRRHYLEATKYDAYEKTEGLHPVPSILNLASLNELEAESPSSRSSSHSHSSSSNALRNRGNGAVGGVAESDPAEKVKQSKKSAAAEEYAGVKRGTKVYEPDSNDGMRKDADVLTKVFVYAGIGWIATIGMPWVFVRVGLSV